MQLKETMEEFKEKAKRAENKTALYGEDIDLSIYSLPQEEENISSLSSLPADLQEIAKSSGIDVQEKERSGSYIQLDQSTIYSRVNEIYKGQLEIISINDALLKYPEIANEYFWKTLPVDQDKYTAFSELHSKNGYFIRVFKGQHVEIPIQACLLLKENSSVQNVHNIIIMEEGSSAQIITGCAVHPKVDEGIHIGISEFFIKNGAMLTFTMIHNWSENFHVRPRSGAIVDDNGKFINNYVLLKPVKSVQMFPIATLKGDNSHAKFNSLMYGLKNSKIDVGSKIVLSGNNSSGEAISRAIANESSIINARGSLVSVNNNTRAHLDCRGILLSEKAIIYAVPELLADGTPKADLSHEAAIGPISDEEVEYLMSRGVSRDDAISLITSGFMDVKILGLPDQLENYINELVKLTAKESL